MIGAGIVIYVAIGFAVVSIGPGAKSIADQISKMRGSALANALTGRSPVPEGKLLALRLMLSVTFVVLWPLLLSTSVMEIRESRKQYKALEIGPAEGVEFSRMGGQGTIHCTECNFSDDITSFMHGMTESGERCCTTGLQCLSCGKFLAVYSEADQPHDAGTRCACGGELSRNHVLFCPQCLSRKLQYELRVIS
jgi:hypothetical protein